MQIIFETRNQTTNKVGTHTHTAHAQNAHAKNKEEKRGGAKSIIKKLVRCVKKPIQIISIPPKFYEQYYVR